MFFNKCDIHENKLSEQLADDNPYKKKLIAMKTPKEKNPIYSTLVFSLLAYCWVFWGILFFNKIYGYSIATVSMLYVIITLFFTYKKKHLILMHCNLAFLFRFVIACFISILIGLADKGNISMYDLIKTFIFLEINSKSYIALTFLLFFLLGISYCYNNSISEIYNYFCDFQRKNKLNRTLESTINFDYFFSILVVISIPFALYIAFNEDSDAFNKKLKLLSLTHVSYATPYVYRTLLCKRYIRIFNKAKKQLTKG